MDVSSHVYCAIWEVWLNSLLFWMNRKLWVRSSSESQACSFNETTFCVFPILCTDIFGWPYTKAFCTDFSPHLHFLSIVGNDLVFSLEGSHPPPLLSVFQNSLVVFIARLLRKKLIHTKCQACVKIFCRYSRKYQGCYRSLTLPVGEELYNVLTTNQGKLLPVIFVMSLVVMFQM